MGQRILKVSDSKVDQEAAEKDGWITCIAEKDEQRHGRPTMKVTPNHCL